MKEIKKWEIDQLLEDAWLRIKVDEEKLFNPLLAIPDEMADIPAKYLFWIMSRPEYISFFASEILNVHLIPIQCAVLRELWIRKFPMFIAHRGFAKSFILAVHALRRMIFMPGRKIIITGAAFRQAKIIFEYMERIWDNAPLLRDFAGNGNNITHSTDMWQFTIGQSICKAIPTGHDGSKIRGQRANDILSDEFASINKEVFETVIAGFGAVSSNPIDNVKYHAKKNLLKELNLEHIIEERDPIDEVGNQVVISGTADYSFNHFCNYWKMWTDIINSKGDMKILEEKYGPNKFQSNFNWKDYSVMRFPIGILPKGFMEDAQVSRAKATIHTGTYLMEYGSIFINDSSGFFKRSLLEKASVSTRNEIILPSGKVFFEPMLIGNPYSKYVYGIDPASEVDNFSIIIVECMPDHRRIVYGWTINRKIHKERIKIGQTVEHDFYAYVARKIRDLMKVFPCIRMAIDTQGGGYSVMEALNSSGKLENHEVNIWPIIDDNKEKDTDGNPGLHIIDPIQFSDSTWVSEANHALKMDFQNQQLIFPFIDSISGALAENESNNLYDGLEDCIMEIEELKNELCTIVYSRSDANQRDRWSTPEVKMEGAKKGRMRKDRYSSLLMANMAARQIMIANVFSAQVSEGGWAGSFKSENSGPDFIGPAWFTDKMKDVY